MTGLSKSEIEQRGHPVWVEVDLAAIRHNVAILRGLAPSSEVMGVVKGYAYGHGNPASAQAMLDGGATRLGVARVAEALHLREAGISAPIHLFTEPPPQAVATLLDHEITPTVYTKTFAFGLAEAASQRGLRVGVHLKLDTGMNRVGVPLDAADDLVRTLRRLDGLWIEGLWSHFATADVIGHPFVKEQLDRFWGLAERLQKSGMDPPIKHIANSAATMSMPESQLDLVRCGIACYGLWPAPAFRGTADLRPALSLRARVGLVKLVEAGGALSYGLSYGLRETSRVVTVPAGYADGYDRGFSATADVLLRGRRYRVSGAVCMDQFMVDVGSAEVEAGDDATLIGKQGSEHITAEELGSRIGTINYEITSRIPSRVPRLYLNEQRATRAEGLPSETTEGLPSETTREAGT
ncbi:MAG: alanine racemase [Actinomycetota bacterium]|nr:alanine racemase [Actinomycetota bacterium]